MEPNSTTESDGRTTIVQRALERAATLGTPEGETLEERGERAALLLATISMIFVATVWSGLYALLGRYVTAAIPGSYAVLTALSLVILAIYRRLDWYRSTQILLLLVLPFGVQATLGGFEQGSAVVLWAFLPVVGALIFHSRRAGLWLLLYLLGLATMALLNDRLRAQFAALAPGPVAVFWVGNIGGISVMVFFVMRHFIAYVQRQRTIAQDALATVESQARELRGARARLEEEVEVARRIQLAMLPHGRSPAGLEVAARMLPAAEVGGDYFDVLPQEGGCWLAVGDVSGHGLTAGLVALMVQNVVAALVERDGRARPGPLVAILNRVLFENVHNRLLQEAFVTFCLLRCSSDGTVELAGAHEPVLIVRARTGRCDVVETPGPWLAVVPDIGESARPTVVVLEPGDVLVLHTDGITEAMNETGGYFGLARLTEILEVGVHDPVEVIRDRVFDAVRSWQPNPLDDRTLLVARYQGEPP